MKYSLIVAFIFFALGLTLGLVLTPPPTQTEKLVEVEVQFSPIGKPRCPVRNGGMLLTYEFAHSPSITGLPTRLFCHYGPQ